MTVAYQLLSMLMSELMSKFIYVLADDVTTEILPGTKKPRSSTLQILDLVTWVYSTWVYTNVQYMLNMSTLQLSKIINNYMNLAFSSLRTMTGTTGQVFPLILRPISFKSDRCGPTFKGVWVFRILLKTKICCQNAKSAISIYYIPNDWCSKIHIQILRNLHMAHAYGLLNST
jgi:hypothetical protein